jgi:hypothetical protein
VQILRIFIDNENFIVQLIRKNGGNFYSADYSELIDFFKKIDINKIIVNDEFQNSKIINKLIFYVGSLKNKYIEYC